MPKLLIINVSINRGSTGKIAEQIGNKAQSHGWDCYVGYGNFNIGSKMQAYHISNKWYKRLHAIESRLFDNHGLSSRLTTKRFIKYIEKIQPDIIHIHNIHGYYINYKQLFEFFKSYGRPVVWTLHDGWSFTGHCAFFDYPKCEKWKSHCQECPCLKKYPSSFRDRSYKNFELKKSLFSSLENLNLVPVSDWLGDQLSESYLKDVARITIHNGIDLGNFKPMPKKSTGEFNILGVSNVWEPRKGLPDFIKLRQMLPAEYKITLVGLKEEQIKELPDGLTGITRTENQAALAKLYAESDVFVNPTYEDNFPTTNIEALACGTPVITYKTGGSPEAIDEKTGVVVEQGDVKQLAAAIMQMRKNPLCSEDCVNRAHELFDKDKCFEKYIELYNSLL